MASPGVSVEIVNQVPAADNQNAFASQGRESLADFKVEGCRLGFVDAELDVYKRQRAGRATEGAMVEDERAAALL